MKYMGSKRYMLLNGLGDALGEAVPQSRRFVDLFTGSGAVAWHVGQKFDVPVLATDLQSFCVALADAVTSRTTTIESAVLLNWIDAGQALVKTAANFKDAAKIQAELRYDEISHLSTRAQNLCANSEGIISRAYGGYYYSSLQAMTFDALRQTLPEVPGARSVALAALIWAASRCAAAPGHTAQPFKANATAGRFLKEAWLRDPIVAVNNALLAIAPLRARVAGEARQGDALSVATTMDEGDLAFLDPPYSGVHYSRFYHVLETLTKYEAVEVSGTGRYPPKTERPQSQYSVQTEAKGALQQLFKTLSSKGCSVVVTFPAGKASNGLSGDVVRELAESSFKIKSAKVSGRFSTMGGNLRNRDARQTSEELILTLTPC